MCYMCMSVIYYFILTLFKLAFCKLVGAGAKLMRQKRSYSCDDNNNNNCSD